jgi:alkylation response protein AidB-like acyl-CoA dehydrogenase
MPGDGPTRLKDRVPETDRLAKLPDATVRELTQEGLLTLCLPRKYGGGEVSLSVFMQAVSELARGDASAAWVAAILNGCTWIEANAEGDELAQDLTRSLWRNRAKRDVAPTRSRIGARSWRTPNDDTRGKIKVDGR